MPLPKLLKEENHNLLPKTSAPPIRPKRQECYKK